MGQTILTNKSLEGIGLLYEQLRKNQENDSEVIKEELDKPKVNSKNKFKKVDSFPIEDQKTPLSKVTPESFYKKDSGPNRLLKDVLVKPLDPKDIKKGQDDPYEVKKLSVNTESKKILTNKNLGYIMEELKKNNPEVILENLKKYKLLWGKDNFRKLITVAEQRGCSKEVQNLRLFVEKKMSKKVKEVKKVKKDKKKSKKNTK